MPNNDRLESFEVTLRRENEQIHPADDLAARIEMGLDDNAPPSDRYRIVITASPFHRRLRRPFLAIAALIAIGVTATLIILHGAAPQATRSVAIDDSFAVKDESAVEAKSIHRASVAINDNAPTIMHELPTERNDVTIVWLYDIPKSTQSAEPRTEPVGVVPTNEILATGTHS